MTSLFIDYLKDDNNPFPSIQCPITNETYYSPLHLYYNLITQDEGIKTILKNSHSFSDIFIIRKNFKDFLIRDKYKKRCQELWVIDIWCRQYPDVDQGDLMIFSSIIGE